MINRQITILVLFIPWAFWVLCLLTGIFAFGPLGFLALAPCGVLAFTLTSRKRLHLSAYDQYPLGSIIIRVIALLYALPFVGFAMLAVVANAH